MNKKIAIAGGCLLTCLLIPFSSGYADFGSIFKKVQEVIGGSSGVSQNEIVDGLKEALQIGTGNTVQALSQLNGYYGNPQLKIPLPQSFQKFDKILRATGFESELDAFELSMNRAAEKAAPEAKALFVDAIKSMTFADADKILKGADNEATVYFKNKTSEKLQALFKPIIGQSMNSVGVTRYYQSLTEKIQTLPFVSDYAVDLDAYVTEKSIDGLFFRLAEEEAKIRNDPAARVTELLKKVFR
ncbi:DUF4197 domain-containing protein [uncultured Desulfosarcina sp.]|uniref:DUF4197 domain-containing protein n=1 Tax=uncultured Desulfosarcina sp. TaxID=218289 RepID=UPI0029C83E14|nr:DUF4197 domain-containing protein [uncultured Desulfosarcina sp.]